MNPFRAADTTDEADKVQREIWRRMSGSQRLELAGKMSDDIRRLAADGIRHRHPDYSEQDVNWALFRQLLGDDLFGRAYPEAPRLET